MDNNSKINYKDINSYDNNTGNKQQVNNNNNNNSQQNYNNNNQQQNYNNNSQQNYNNNNQQQNYNLQPSYVVTTQDILNNAYALAQSANKHLKEFSYSHSLVQFEESLSMCKKVFSGINDEEMKKKVENFMASIKSQIVVCNHQLKHQYEYKQKAGFSSKYGTEKVDYLENFRKEKNSTNANPNSYSYSNNNNNNSNVQIHQISPEKKQNIQNRNENSDKDEVVNSTKNKDKVVTDDITNKILSEILDSNPNIKFTDVIGLAQAKQILKEIIVLPNLRPDLFASKKLAFS